MKDHENNYEVASSVRKCYLEHTSSKTMHSKTKSKNDNKTKISKTVQKDIVQSEEQLLVKHRSGHMCILPFYDSGSIKT